MNPSQLNNYKQVYFLGIGGIGMSALARYFRQQGLKVLGYDKTPTELTKNLEEEGCEIHYEDLGKDLPVHHTQFNKTLFILTPAIPAKHAEWNFLKEKGVTIYKRAEVLGMLTRQSKALCVAGTHGKTTTSAMIAHILHESDWKCNAFLGGISANFNSNLVLDNESTWSVIEADEFDRSFLHLSPFASIVTSADPDHLDIYGTAEHFQEGFRQYAMKTDMNGRLIQREGLNLPSICKSKTYALDSDTADYTMRNLYWKNNVLSGDVYFGRERWNHVELGIPGLHNAENALACIALLNELGMDEDDIRFGLKTFKGVKRRFEYHIKSDELVYIDDYAHHPQELKSLIDSLRMLYPKQKIYGIFQPHLFTRTRDFANDFAIQLSRFDETILMPIYPAREEPIHGITSDWLFEKINAKKKFLFKPSEVLQHFSTTQKGIIVTVGAGDIDRIVQPLKTILQPE